MCRRPLIWTGRMTTLTHESACPGAGPLKTARTNAPSSPTVSEMSLRWRGAGDAASAALMRPAYGDLAEKATAVRTGAGLRWRAREDVLGTWLPSGAGPASHAPRPWSW